MNNVGLITANKHLSLQYLHKIKGQYYCNPDCSPPKDYVPESVDVLIWQKQEKISELNQRRLERDLLDHEIDMYLINEIKYCTNCKNDLAFKEFDKDISKLTFGLRSHCKSCRKDKREIPF